MSDPRFMAMDTGLNTGSFAIFQSGRLTGKSSFFINCLRAYTLKNILTPKSPAALEYYMNSKPGDKLPRGKVFERLKKFDRYYVNVSALQREMLNEGKTLYAAFRENESNMKSLSFRYKKPQVEFSRM